MHYLKEDVNWQGVTQWLSVSEEPQFHLGMKWIPTNLVVTIESIVKNTKEFD